jgi:hypothetical protein
MASDYSYSTTPPKQGSTWKRWLILLSAAFVIGLGVMAWAVTRWTPAREIVLGTDPAIPLPTTSPSPGKVGSGIQPNRKMPPPILTQQPIEERLATLEDRIGRLSTVGGSSGASARAEGLLTAFAARRAIDRGLALGYLEGSLQQQFGESQPRSVGIIIAAARNPITLDAIKDQLTAIGPKLISNAPDKGMWDSFRDSMSSLIIVRKAGALPTNPADRLARAERMIDAGRVDVALAEVARLPGAQNGADWMRNARRLVEAHRALDVLEAAAIMQPGKSEPRKALPPITPSDPKAAPKGNAPVIPDDNLF